MKNLLTGLCLLFVTGAPPLRSAEQPNILLIFADDIGYEALGCYGGLDFQTPRLDRMAEEGIRFSRAYTSSVCTPSRVSLHTGLYTARHGHVGVLPVHKGTDQKVDFKKMPTFASLLRNEGYLTSVTGKWQLATLEIWPDHIREAGFDSWCVWQIWKRGEKTLRHWNGTFNEDGPLLTGIEDRFGPDILADFVIEKMTEAKKAERPFLIVHNELLPHYPMIDTPLDRELGREASLANMIEYMDVLVGRLLDAVEELGLRENTCVVFMGDNGTEERYFKNPKAGEQGEQPHTRHTRAGNVNGGKHDLNDAGSHVPLIVWGPKAVAAGAVCDDLVDVVDLFPTFCDWAGTTIPETISVDGRSIAPQVRGKPGEKREWTHQGLGKGETLFDGSWRLFRTGGQLVDARQLPRERDASREDPEAKQATGRLSPVFKLLTREGPRPPVPFGQQTED